MGSNSLPIPLNGFKHIIASNSNKTKQIGTRCYTKCKDKKQEKVFRHLVMALVAHDEFF